MSRLNLSISAVKRDTQLSSKLKKKGVILLLRIKLQINEWINAKHHISNTIIVLGYILKNSTHLDQYSLNPSIFPFALYFLSRRRGGFSQKRVLYSFENNS